MKAMILGLIALTSLPLSAAVYKGTIKNFSGFTVESRQAYSYNALETAKGQRIKMPNYVNTDLILEMEKNTVTIEADLMATACTDMSRACTSGRFQNVKSIQFLFDVENRKPKTFSGKLRSYTGRFVERRETSTYHAIDTATQVVSFPEFLNSDILLKNFPNADYTVTAEIIHVMCHDLGHGCGPTPLTHWSKVNVKF